MSLFFKIFLLAGIGFVFVGGSIAYAGTLSCAVRTSNCDGGEVEIFEMQNTTNSHAGLSSASYNNLVCCTGVTGLGISCTEGVTTTVLKLSGTTNAHIRQGTLADYPGANNACLSVPSGGSVSVGYQADNCDTPIKYDTILGSMTSSTNAHVGTSTVYTTKVCATAKNTIISITVLDTSISYGSVVLGAQKSTLDTGDSPDIVNSGNVTENFLIKGYNTTGTGQAWTLDTSTSTLDHYKDEFSISGAFPGTALTTGNVTATSSVLVNSTSTLDLRISTPGASTDHNLKNIKVTITAEATP